MGSDAARVEGLVYSQLKDLRLEIDDKDTNFSLCFWVYLHSSTQFPATILRQLHSSTTDGIPFLSLNKEKKMMLLPSYIMQEEAPDPGDSLSLAEEVSISSDIEFPLEKWVHVGCEVYSNVTRLHINGIIVGEKYLLGRGHNLKNKRITFAAIDGVCSGIRGYVHDVNFSPYVSSPMDHHLKDPPVELSIDVASVSEGEEGNDGVWNIVDGKASSWKNFSVDVILLDAFGKPVSVNKEMEVVASLIYADDHSAAGASEEGEAPLFTIFDGIEFSSCDKPAKLLHGRASFKFRISQAPSKCGDRLFCIKFKSATSENYPFLEAISPPIRCISRSCNNNISTITWKKLPFGVHLFNGSSSPGDVDGQSRPQMNTVCESRPSPPSKRVKLGQDSASSVVKADTFLKRLEEESYSNTCASDKVMNDVRTNLEHETENPHSSTNSIGTRNQVFNKMSYRSDLVSDSMSYKGDLVSDLGVFRYCLGGLSERLLMLKELSSFASDEAICNFADRVSHYSGCIHHRRQILIAKKLLVEGEGAWNRISHNTCHVSWENVAFEIEEQFMKTASCNNRPFTQQDLNFLRRISKCNESVTRESFDKMWRWLYPVALTISRDEINKLWASTSPRWIEGFISKEEVEYALQGPMGIQEPGTFLLRFPTSRSWPHVDAGSLVVTYVGRDHTLHHRLLSLDDRRERKSLWELFLEEPELSHLGRITRNELTA